MGHRQITSQMADGEHDQNWNHMHTDQHYVHLGRTNTSENNSFIYPVENMSIDGIPFTTSWNSSTRLNRYPFPSLNIEVPPHQSDASVASHEHFLHSSDAGAFLAVSENYTHQPSFSNYDRHAFHAVDSGFIDLTMGSERGPRKRKSPGIPSVIERGSTRRYFNAGNSTDLPMSSELRQEMPSIDSHHMPWDHVTMTPTFRGNDLSIRGEDSLRNVRSRSALDLESNLARTYLSSNHSHNSHPTGPPIDLPSTVDLSGPSSSTSTRDWSQISISPTGPPIDLPSTVLLSETSGFGHETGHFIVGNGSSNTSVDIGGYHHEFGTSRNSTVPQSFQSNVTQSAKGVRSNYSQRSTPTFRASSSLRLGHMVPSDDGLHMVAERYSSRHPRPLTSIGRRNSERNRRSRISSDRYQLADEAGLHDRFSSEGFMIVDRSSFYGSRNMFDQHRDMRMDIDNMSYEELLALEERIGHVSTGLSDDLISKCVTETIYCCSWEQNQEEETCVICLEEYKNMDDVGTLKTCGHDYHVSCIRKWLSMKNLCPICKASAMADNNK